MTPHPYIGRTFRLELVKLGRRIVFEKAVCVLIVDHGAGIFRLPDNSHISAHLTEVVSPLDEPAPAATHALLHMLGLDADHREPWRNHFVTGPDEGDDIRELVARGYVVEFRRPSFLAVSDRVFVATDAGKAAASEENQRVNPPPKMNRRRYLHWLRISDADPDLTFGEYLRRRLYNDPAWGSP